MQVWSPEMLGICQDTAPGTKNESGVWSSELGPNAWPPPLPSPCLEEG